MSEEIEIFIRDDNTIVIFSEEDSPEIEELSNRLGDPSKGICGFNGVCNNI